MRIHSIAPEISRQSTQDDVLPLTKPIVGTSGKVYTELPIPKGTIIAIPTSGYNLYVFFENLPLSRQDAHTIVLVAGTKMYGVQTLMCSDQSAGLK